MPSLAFDTDLGRAIVSWTARGLRSFRLPGGALPETEPAREPVPAFVRRAVQRAQQHLSGAPQSFDDVPLDLDELSPFQVAVYRALCKVPIGSTVSYMQLAKLAGSAGASRAVGTAMAKNPLPLFVPCHRVVTERGALGGFSAAGGVATKVRILALEGLTIDPSTQLTLADAVLGRHIAKIGACGLEVKRPASVFAALARSIVYQQVSTKAAATVFARVLAAYPNGLRAEDTAALGDQTFLACGMSRSKLAAFRDLSAKTLSGSIPTMAQASLLSDDELVAQLSQVRGIGRWSVEMFLMFSLGRPDVLACGDYGLRKGFQKLFKKQDLPTLDELAARGERWRPFRSTASWYLWRAAETA